MTMTIEIPIEDFSKLAKTGLVQSANCNGTDLYPDDFYLRKCKHPDFDYVLLGKQPAAGGANKGDIVVVTIYNSNNLRQKIIAKYNAEINMFNSAALKYQLSLKIENINES